MLMNYVKIVKMEKLVHLEILAAVAAAPPPKYIFCADPPPENSDAVKFLTRPEKLACVLKK